MSSLTMLQQLGLALALGLLVGLQRERSDNDLAGFRTFPLITVFGTLCAYLSRYFQQSWLLLVGFLGLICILLIGNVTRWTSKGEEAGVTTEVTVLLMFALGAFLTVGPPSVAIAITGCITVLLFLKEKMHTFARRLGKQDVQAVIQFVLITCVILPVLPNKTYGPYDVLNPYEIWWMVVLVVCISLLGYVLYKALGARVGLVLGGIIGGVISSTATTVSYARRRLQREQSSGWFALVILVASAISVIRVLIEVLVVATPFWRQLSPPLLIMFGFLSLLSGGIWLFDCRRQAPPSTAQDEPAPPEGPEEQRKTQQERTQVAASEELQPPTAQAASASTAQDTQDGQSEAGDEVSVPEAARDRALPKSRKEEQANPTELPSALIFAFLYALVLVGIAAGKKHFADEGLYVIAALSGVTDMDAITLSISRLLSAQRLQPAMGWRLILVAMMANLVFKGLIVVVLGGVALRRRIVLLFGLSLLCGASLLVFWR